MRRSDVPDTVRSTEAFNWLCGDFRARYRDAITMQHKGGLNYVGISQLNFPFPSHPTPAVRSTTSTKAAHCSSNSATKSQPNWPVNLPTAPATLVRDIVDYQPLD